MDVGHGVVVRVQPFRIGLIAGKWGAELRGEKHARGRKRWRSSCLSPRSAGSSELGVQKSGPRPRASVTPPQESFQGCRRCPRAAGAQSPAAKALSGTSVGKETLRTRFTSQSGRCRNRTKTQQPSSQASSGQPAPPLARRSAQSCPGTRKHAYKGSGAKLPPPRAWRPHAECAGLHAGGATC